MNRRNAFVFIYLFGVISLLGDIVYESARSIGGQYLGVLGASAATVGIIAGIGEFLGYIFRLISGYLSDRLNSYWLSIILGYGFLISVPMLSITDSWISASFLFVLERIGKGIRSPAKDALLSEPVRMVGTGFGFGILELIDQVGALIGPILLFIVFLKIDSTLSKENYQLSLSLLWLPFVILMLILIFTYTNFKDRIVTIGKAKGEYKITKLERDFWFYCLYVFFTTIGFISFALIGYHIKSNSIIIESYIVVLYAVAMAVDGLFAILLGKIYDRLKVKKNIFYLIPPLTFITVYLSMSNSLLYILIGLILWGIVMSIHETILKAYIVDTVETDRGFAFAIFNTVYGVALFLGSTFIGFVYQKVLELLPIYLFLTQSLAIFILMKTGKNI